MGILRDAVRAKQNKLQERRTAPAPNYAQDPNEALKYIKSRNAVAYEEAAMRRKLIAALRTLPKDKQDEFYERCVPPASRTAFPKAAYEDYLNPASANGRQNSWILNDAFFSGNMQQIDVLEEMIGEHEANELATDIEYYIVPPTDSSFPKEEMLVYPMTAEIEEIKESLDMFRPDWEFDARLLDEVKEDLAYVNEESRELINKIDGGGDGVKGYQTMVNSIHYDNQNRFLGHTLANGKFKDKLPTFPSSEAADHFMYSLSDIGTDLGGNLTPEELEELRQVKPEINPELKKDILAVTDKMEKLGEESFRNENSNAIFTGGTAEDKMFKGEQGVKLYGYWPLFQARQELVNAVRTKDMDQIRTAHLKYRETKKELDDMLAIVRKHPTGLSEGNLNATRALKPGMVNPLPPEHMQDFVGHSQVNGLFGLYALSKNTGSTPAQLLEDPSKVMAEAGRRHVQRFGLGSRKTAGEKLAWAFSDAACTTYFVGDWTNNIGQLCSRAFNNVAAMAENQAERERIAGVGQIAMGSGSAVVNAHMKEWNKLVNSTKEQKNLLYQHAVLLPEDEFKPLEYAAAFGQPDWKERLDTGALIDRLKQEGKLDYGKLADRVEQIAEEARDKVYDNDTKFSRDSLIVSSHKMFKEILKKASPQERETEGYKKLEQYTNKMLLTTAAFQQGQQNLEEWMDVQKEAKKGIFLSSENSDEQKKMVRAQNTFRFKLMQMQGKELPAGVSEEDKEYLKTISLKAAYDVARDATFDYCTKKTKDGASRHFVHNIGSERLEAAETSLKIMDRMADNLDLRSPAQKLIDETRLEVYDKRRLDDWTPEKTEIAAAKLMYAMTLEHQKMTPEEQKRRLQPQRLEAGISQIRQEPAFRKMMRKEGAGSVADFMAEGHAKLTDAYVRGMNSAARDEHREAGKDPKQMSAEEKGNVWKNKTLQL